MSLTAELVIEKLEECVNERGRDYVYERPSYDAVPGDSNCLYVHEQNQPGCIIGCMLHKLGVSIDDLRAHEGKSADTMIMLFFPGTPVPIINALSSAQGTQDRGTPWGEVLDYVKDRLNVDA